MVSRGGSLLVLGVGLGLACMPGPAEVAGKRCSAERSCGPGFECVDGQCSSEGTGTGAGTDGGDGGGDGATEEILVGKGSTWKYLATHTRPSDDWTLVTFDDAAWPSGTAPLGYGDTGEVSTVDFGPTSNRYITSYYRRSFELPEPSRYSRIVLRLRRDDGGAAYVNGTEVLRSNLPAGPLTQNTLASDNASGAAELTYFEAEVPRSSLVSGRNQLAAEVHQNHAESNDMIFDLEVVGHR